MISRYPIAATLGIVLGAVAMLTSSTQAGPSAAELVQMADDLRDSLARIEYTLKFDKGQPPTSTGLVERCPSCGEYHVNSGETFVEQERPMETAGFVLSPTRVLTTDIMLHPRFIERIEVVRGGQRIAATPVAHAEGQYAVILELAEPLDDVRPLKFHADAEGPYLTATYQRLNGDWTVHIKPLSMNSIDRRGDRAFISAEDRGLIIGGDGRPVALNMLGELPLDDSWKGSPEQWSWLDADQYRAVIDDAKSASAVTVLRTKLNLRSPKSNNQDPYSYYGYGNSDAEQATELDVLSVLIGHDRALVLAPLRSRVTARLERITLFPPAGEPVDATFEASLRDYGAFIATLETPIEGAAPLGTSSIREFQHELLTCVNVSLQGETRTAYVRSYRIPGFDVGWRRNIYPSVPGDESGLFLFDRNGHLIALPIALRPKAGEYDQWSYDAYPRLTAAAQINAVLGNLSKHIDDSNMPLSEEEESRVAWTGVVLQSLDPELANLYEVSELSNDGMIGGIVSFIYPDSPAEDAGIRSSDILLRVHVDRLPRPLDINVGEDHSSNFPWHQLDEVPEEYFEMIPRPWPTVDNQFNRMLTELGFGTDYRLEVFRDGETMQIPMTVVESPPHHDAAPKYKSETIGVTVRPLTYEVRRQYQKSPDDPGLIVTHIEPGSKASVGGVKPFEMIIDVNDQPVATVDDFKAAIHGRTELRMTVERMTQSRVVKLRFDKPIEVEGIDVAAPEPMHADEPIGEQAPADEAASQGAGVHQ